VTTQPPLSPAAQAVLDAANGASTYGPDDVLNDARWIAAAALRAAADQAFPRTKHSLGLEPIPVLTAAESRVRYRLLVIAAELEAM
jgi:hypothetical protein